MRVPLPILFAVGLVASGCANTPAHSEPSRKANVTTSPIKVPYGAVQACHDGLKKAGPTLWTAFQKQVEVANQAQATIERLDEILRQRQSAWDAFVVAGGNAKTAKAHWDCSIADLADALVDAEIAAVASQTADVKKQRLVPLKAWVQKNLAWTTRHTAMELALDVALGQ